MYQWNVLEVNNLYGLFMEAIQAANNGNWQEVQPSKIKTKRPRRALPPLPSVAGASEMVDAVFNCKVDSTPSNWESVPLWSAFSLSPDGSFPKVKVTKSKFSDLRTGKSDPAGSGRCYRIIF